MTTRRMLTTLALFFALLALVPGAEAGSAPVVTVTPTGCTDCRAGDPLGFVVTIESTEPDFREALAYLRVIVWLPGGPGRYFVLIPQRPILVTDDRPIQVTGLPEVLPDGTETGTYVIEASVLRPANYDLMARHSAVFRVHQ